jgi:DNA polymerase
VSELTDLYQTIAQCQRCDLAKGRKLTVPGEGPEIAALMFVGESPGYHENQQGRPFVGAAGHFLEELLASIGMKRDQVYIANVIKCRPPGNRDPLNDELEACRPYLLQQLDLINPRLIVTLGRFSMAHFLGNVSISRIHGQPQQKDGRIVFPMFHPAAALHQPKYRSAIEQDFLKIPGLLAQAKTMATAEPPPPPPQQLSLF